MLKLTQEFFEALAEKLALPIAILGAGGALVMLVVAMVAMWYFAPGTAGTAAGPAMFDHQVDSLAPGGEGDQANQPDQPH